MKTADGFLPLLFLVFLCAAACNEPQEEIPPGILPADSMVMVMTELHLLESKMMLLGNRHISATEKGAFLKGMLMKTGLDSARFTASFEYYAGQPELFTEIYEKVITEISRRQAAENKNVRMGE